jgi:primary-amine oxidase
MRVVDNPDANYYAYPLDICAEVSEELTVTKIYRLPSSENEQMNNSGKKFDPRKIHTSSEYHPDLKAAPRDTTKLYHITQPDGPSFTTAGNLICWEKWRMRVGFNYREGLTLHDVRYDGRSLFYRLSLA